MFRSFMAHSRVFRSQKLSDYFMISSGTNQFPMPKMWKESMHMELESDFLYRWYTDSRGFQCITSAVKVYEDYISGPSLDRLIRSRRKVCMATGGCGAASAVFEYLEAAYGRCRVILAGMNYSLYERIAKKHRFPVQELCRASNPDAIPLPADFSQMEHFPEKPVFVFSVPNNPTGESYSIAEFSEIVAEIKRHKGFIVLDQVCNLIISKQPLPLLEPVITAHDYWHSCAVINSFSKTDAVAGLRLGYVYGEDALIQSCAALNADTVMNPPTFPALPIVLTCLFRCMYLNDLWGSPSLRAKLPLCFRRLFFLTSAVVPPAMDRYVHDIFDHLEDHYLQYVEEQLENEAVIHRNYEATCGVLKSHIQKISKCDGGFNFCIWFRWEFRMDQISLIEKLIDSTGVAILTESSFSLNPVNGNWFLIRFSTACDPAKYTAALQRLKAFFESEAFVFEKCTD